jgi:hypothetical protein
MLQWPSSNTAEVSRLRHEPQIKDPHARSEASKLHIQLQQTEATLRSHQVQMRSADEDLQKHDAKHKAEMDALRLQCQFFKSNSQRLSQLVRGGSSRPLELTPFMLAKCQGSNQGIASLEQSREPEMLLHNQQHQDEMDLDSTRPMLGTF